MGLVIVEGPRDAVRVREFQSVSEAKGRVLRGRSIGDVAALMKRADLVLCNDTGVMHVAAAVGATVLAVFGPTDPHRWAPHSESLTVVRAADGDLGALSAERVLATAREMMAKAQKASIED